MHIIYGNAPLTHRQLEVHGHGHSTVTADAFVVLVQLHAEILQF